MKKIIISISGLLIFAFIAIRVVSAQTSMQDVKKAATETAMNCSKCPSATACGEMKDSKKTETKSCDPSKCKAMGCDPAKCKEGKCDTAKCKANSSGSKTEMKKCDSSRCCGNAKK